MKSIGICSSGQYLGGGGILGERMDMKLVRLFALYIVKGIIESLKMIEMVDTVYEYMYLY